MLGELLAFLGVALVVIVVPGPDTALTVRNALAGGRRAGVATAAGVAAGQAVWTVATGVGIAELIQASEPAFLVMKAAGAAYLIFLGLQSLWTAARPSGPGRGCGQPDPLHPALGYPPVRGPHHQGAGVPARPVGGVPARPVGGVPVCPGPGWWGGLGCRPAGDCGRGWSAIWPIRRWRRSF